MPIDELRRRLVAGVPVHGTWVTWVRTPGVVRLAGACGMDFVFIDMQHSSFDLSIVSDMCEIGRACGVVPIVRPGSPSPDLIGRLLDVGAAGIMLDDVTSSQQVLDCATAMTYPPVGRRSVSLNGPGTDYAPGVPTSGRPLLVAQIESVAGLAVVNEVVETEVVDVVEIGRNDLAASLGLIGQIDHERVIAAMSDVVAECRSQNVSVGVNARTTADAKKLAELGVTCFSHGTDKSILAAAYRSLVSGVLP